MARGVRHRSGMLQLLVAGLLGSATLASGVTLDSVQSPQGLLHAGFQWDDRGAGCPNGSATAPDGCIYVVGNIRAPSLPHRRSVRRWSALCWRSFPISITCVEAFIARISAASRILYATCLGGIGEDSANDASSDAGRHADVTGIATQQDQYNA